MEKSAVTFTKDQIRALKQIAKKQKLKGANVLDEYSEDEMVKSFNGAGSSAAPEWERRILTKILEKKLPAILIHDIAYRKGGADKDFDRVNQELQDNITMLDNDKDSTWWNFVGRMAKKYSDEKGRPGWGVA